MIKDKRTKQSLTALLLVLTSTAPAFCEEPLQGKIEASRELPAVPPALRAGAKFDEANLPQAGASQDWRWIPSWAAGTLHRETQTNFLPTGPQIVLSRSINEPQSGEQMDNRGEIWSHMSLPQIRTIESEYVTEWQVVTDIQRILTNEYQIVRRFRFMSIDVNKRNHRIVKVTQKEQFDTQRPEGRGAVFQDSWLTIYNQFGRRLTAFAVQAHQYQIRSFQPIAIDPKTGLDLHKDFKNYLMSHGLASLAPIDNPTQISDSAQNGLQ